MVTVSGQTYRQLIKQADSLYNSKDYKKSNDVYQQAFKFEKKNVNDLYNAACSAALAGDTKNSFEFLKLACQNGWLNIDHMKKDSDLNGLHNDGQWIALLSKMQNTIDSIEANYDKPLQKELLEIFNDDQSIRNQYITATKKLGYNNPTADSLGKIMIYKDSINLIKVTKILDEKGWVGKDKVGMQANQTLFLVIQHSDLKTQEKYLPMMREAVKKGNASASALALLEDRTALGQGKKQIYGSQIFTNHQTHKSYVAPLEDPDNVDKRRTEVGLGPLSDYVYQFGIMWDIEDYKKHLPEYEKQHQESLKTK
ncbi:MAG: hypothetical protein PHP42_01030 [Bacteroidota bacterium]|nr:hypothetical protein [Bacteroidota bacterium]